MPLHEQAVRDAMHRLLEGRSVHTDGRLTQSNLAREAGLSRPTALREVAVVAEFDRHVERLESEGSVPADKHQAMIARLQKDRRDLRRIADRYRQERDEAVAQRAAMAVTLRVRDEQLAQAESRLQSASRLSSLPHRR